MNDLLVALGAERYSPWSLCLTEDPLMMFLYTFSGLVIVAGLVGIGAVLCLSGPTPSALRRPMKRLIGAVMLLCAADFLVFVLSIFWGIYRLGAFATAATAAMAFVTAVVAIKDALAYRA